MDDFTLASIEPCVNGRSEIVALWDGRREGLTLGGLLILRQEIELIAHTMGLKRGVVHFQNVEDFNSELVDKVFKSEIEFNVESSICEYGNAWPLVVDPRLERSYQSFKRLNALCALLKVRPRLRWDSGTKEAVAHRMKSFESNVITCHLKRRGDFSTLESNAGVENWQGFLREFADSSRVQFLLLGDDDLPASLTDIEGVISANALDIDLSVQLCLIGMSTGFVGMASGICQGAVFSDAPYVIFKHPGHHSKEMKEEFGDADRFLFALPGQHFWRTEDSKENLREAMNLLLKVRRHNG